MVGVIFSKPSINIENILQTSLFLGLCLLNGLSVYLINAGLGYKQDRVNERLGELQQVKRSYLLYWGFLLLFISLTGLYFFSPRLLLPAVGVYFIWIVYGLPSGLKGIPIMGLACAFIGQLLHFHIGYLVFSDWSLHSLLLSIYFSLLFTGGHALHEVIDYEPDKQAGLRTSAVFFGRKNLLGVSNYVFVTATVYLIALTAFGIVDWILIIPYCLAFALQLWFMSRVNSAQDNAQLFEYRRKYMTAYLFATVAVMIILYI